MASWLQTRGLIQERTDAKEEPLRRFHVRLTESAVVEYADWRSKSEEGKGPANVRLPEVSRIETNRSVGRSASARYCQRSISCRPNPIRRLAMISEDSVAVDLRTKILRQELYYSGGTISYRQAKRILSELDKVHMETGKHIICWGILDNINISRRSGRSRKTLVCSVEFRSVEDSHRRATSRTHSITNITLLRNA